MEDVELVIAWPWEEAPTRPVVSFGDETLAFKAQLPADAYADALTAIGDPSKRPDFLLLCVSDESRSVLEGLLEDYESGIGAVAAARTSTALARFYGMIAGRVNGGEGVDPTKPESQPRSRRKPRSGASGSGKKQG